MIYKVITRGIIYKATAGIASIINTQMGPMTFECSFRHDYLKSTNSASIENSAHKALDEIRIHLYSEAKLPQQPSFRRISREQAILESREPYRGRWDAIRKQMTFVEGLWCVSTVIHETLHAVCGIQTLDEAHALKPLFEGLTECLTGYILFKEYDHVYSNCWKTDEASWCKISDLYRPNCRRWGAFFHFVPFDTVLPLYFEPMSGWSERCTKFVEAVRQNGYNSFRDVLNDVLTASTPVTDFTFWTECRRVLGKRFMIISGTPAALDFAAMP